MKKLTLILFLAVVTVAQCEIRWGGCPYGWLNRNWFNTLNKTNVTAVAGQYSFPNTTENDYFFFAFPATGPQPVSFYLGPLPVSMTIPSPVATNTFFGMVYKVYRSFQQLGGGATTTIDVQ